MSKKSKFEQIELDEDLALFSKEFHNLGEIYFAIEKLEDEVPDKRRLHEFEIWRNKMNFLIDKYNNLCKFKCLKKYG